MKDSTVIDEAYRLVELRLQAQFEAAIAADQRAIGVAGMLIAAASILTALAQGDTVDGTLLIGAAGLVGAAFLAGFAARPQDFYTPGALFEDLAEDIASGADIDQVKTELGGFNDKHSRVNDQQMKRNSRLVMAAFALALVSITFVIVSQGYQLWA